jgi:hypothetical protein
VSFLVYPTPRDKLIKHKVSVIFILPETKGISLERMDKLFGELDYVEAGEQETNAEKIEILALGEQFARSQSVGDVKNGASVHEESAVKQIDSV